MKNRETILYFGSFNPIHNGHTAVARYVLEHGFCDELWFVVSPRNPLKPESVLAGDLDRLRMTEIAASDKLKGFDVRVSDVEFGLPRPSYTIDTLRFLDANYPDNCFSMLVGADIITQLGRWKDHAALIERYKLYVYPRESFSLDELPYNAVYLKDAPMFEYSSTDVREAVASGCDIGDMVAAGVKEYIIENGLWTGKTSK